MLTNQNCICEEIKSGLNLGNSCYHAVQNLASYLLSKNIKIRIYKTITTPVFCMGVWSPTLREEHRLRVFENRVLRGIFGSKRDEMTGGGENCIMKSSIVCTLHQILLG
jgi:hypothetical protein